MHYIPSSDSELGHIIRCAIAALKGGIPVLITGPSGCGKGMLANFLKHEAFPDSKIVALNCGAICTSMAEAELFGFEKGSFTGADTEKKSLFEEANGQIVFLDEIGTMAMEHQVKLLRVIEEKRVKRVGANTERKVSFSLISASNIDFQSSISAGLFRADLYYRIAGFVVKLPDINRDAGLKHYYATKMVMAHLQKNNIQDPVFSQHLIERCIKTHWQGQLREMENFIKLMVCFKTQGMDLPSPSQDHSHTIQRLPEQVNQIERDMITQALKACDANLSMAARQLGIPRTSLIHKVKAYQLSTYIEEYKTQRSNQIQSTLIQYRYNISQAAKVLHMSRKTLYRRLEELSIHGNLQTQDIYTHAA